MQITSLKGEGKHGLVLHQLTGEWVGLILPVYGSDFIENIKNRLIGAQLFEGFLLNDSRLSDSNSKQAFVLRDVQTDRPLCIAASPYL